MNTPEECVARGAAFLDQRKPGWWRKVDLGRLDLKDACKCVLGQVFQIDEEDAAYYWAITKLGLDGREMAFGFMRSKLRSWGELDEAWVAEIKARWESASAMTPEEG